MEGEMAQEETLLWYVNKCTSILYTTVLFQGTSAVLPMGPAFSLLI